MGKLALHAVQCCMSLVPVFEVVGLQARCRAARAQVASTQLGDVSSAQPAHLLIVLLLRHMPVHWVVAVSRRPSEQTQEPQVVP